MIGVSMGNKEVIDFFATHASLLQLRQNTVTATSIHQHHATTLATHNEAGVIAASHHRIAST